MTHVTPIEFYLKEFDKYKGAQFYFHSDIYSRPEVAPFICPRVNCADGFSFSMQASRFHYSMPRVAGRKSYKCMEIGYPSDREPLLEPYKEDLGDSDSKWNNCVYPFVPYEVIEAIVEKHGGIL